MNKSEALTYKYNGYQEVGHKCYTVTLSTYVTSDAIAKSDRMRHFWDHHFIYRFDRILPLNLKGKLDHDYVIERSPEGNFHYHGLMAFPNAIHSRLFPNDQLHPHVVADLASFKDKGKYRPFAVNKSLIERIPDGLAGAWIAYITKTAEVRAAL